MYFRKKGEDILAEWETRCRMNFLAVFRSHVQISVPVNACLRHLLVHTLPQKGDTASRGCELVRPISSKSSVCSVHVIHVEMP